MQRNRDVSPSDIELRAIEEDAPDNTRLLPREDSHVEQPLVNSSKSSFHRRIQNQAKWRSSVLLGAATSSIVLIINLRFTIRVTADHSTQNWIGTIYGGDCTKTNELTVLLYFVINILNTILLGSSNYCVVRALGTSLGLSIKIFCQQCLSAPTRDEVDRAHSQGLWVDIGVPSMRNMQVLGLKKTLLWLFLALSSLTLHLLYNSTVFSTTQANSYYVFSVNEFFLSQSGPGSVNTTDAVSN